MYWFSKVCDTYGSSLEIFPFFMVCFRSKLFSFPILFLLILVFKACITYLHSWFYEQANINKLMRINYIHITVCCAKKLVVAQNQVGMDLIFHNSPCDIETLSTVWCYREVITCPFHVRPIPTHTRRTCQEISSKASKQKITTCRRSQKLHLKIL